uniref:Uncharacterized protein n=1 Tax=Chrysemys picta bellii TaxID=8478 RepID=A0A8C3FIE2_CHRPI
MRSQGELLLGASLEVIPALLHLLARPLPAGDGVDLGGDALPDAPALGHRHLPALGTVQLGVVGAHLLDKDLVLLVGEAGLAQTGDLLGVPGHAWRPMGRGGWGVPGGRGYPARPAPASPVLPPPGWLRPLPFPGTEHAHSQPGSQQAKGARFP